MAADTAEIKPTPEPQGDTSDSEQPAEKEAESELSSEDDDEQISVSIGDDGEPDDDKPDSGVLKEVRKAYERSQKKNLKLQQRLEELEKAQTVSMKLPDPGPMPTIEDCDMDTVKHKERMNEWYQAKLRFDTEQASQKEKQEKIQQHYQAKIQAYDTKKRELKVPDYEIAEATVLEALNVTQRGILIQASENPALLMYALGKNPNKLQEMAALRDNPVKFAFEAGKLEKDLRITKRKPKTEPEKTLDSSGNAIGSQINLDRMRDDVAKTHNINKNLEIRRKMRRQERGG